MNKKLVVYISLGVALLILILLIKKSIESNKSKILYTVSNGVFEDVIVSTGELSSENFIKIQAPSDDLKANGIYEISIARLLPEGTIIDSGMVVAELDQSKVLERLAEIEKSLQNAMNEYENTKLDTSLDLSSLRDQILNNKYNIEELKITLDQSKYESPAVIKQAENSLEKANRELNQSVKSYDLKKKKSVGTVFQKSLEIQRFNDLKKKMLDLQRKLIIASPSRGMLVYYKGPDGKMVQTGSVIQLWREGIVAIIPDFSSMKSNTYINEIEISKVKKGQEAKIGIDAFPDKSYSGKVVYIANIGEQLPNSDAKVFNVQIKLNNTDSILRPGMTTSNKIITASLKNAMFIPIESVQSSGEINFVYMLKGFFTTKRIVELGEFNDNYIIVKKGLKAGDEIYLSMPEENKGTSGFETSTVKDSVRNK